MTDKHTHDHQPHMVNKQARRNFELLELPEAGISLVGSEVKSLRQGRVSFMDGCVRLANGEALLTGVHIAPFPKKHLDVFVFESKRLLHG